MELILRMKGHHIHHLGRKEIEEFIDMIELERSRIEEIFEPIEKLIDRNIKLAEQLLGIN